MSKISWLNAASPYGAPRGDKCIHPPQALGRHIRQRRQANDQEYTHAKVSYNEHMSPQKCIFP